MQWKIIAGAVAVLAAVSGAHEGVAGEHLNIGYYFGHDGSFENPADPPLPATLLVDTHPWELGNAYFKLNPVNTFLLQGWQTNLPGFDTLPVDEQEFGGHGFYSWLDPTYTLGAPVVILHIEHLDERLQLLSPFTLEPLPEQSYLGTDFHLHAVFYVDQSVDLQPEDVLTATFHLSDATGVMADSESFTVQFSLRTCRVDLNDDGVLDFFDVQRFLNYFSSGDMRADLVVDGSLNFFDVQQFLNGYSAGCP